MKNKHKKRPHGTHSRKIESIPAGDLDGFEDACNDLKNMCKIINDQNEINQQLLKNFIKIRLVSIVEFHLKGFVSELIDNQNLNPKNILEED